MRRFYAPIDGELANLYIAEGQPVSKDDVLARLNARGAIEAASNALEARLKLEDAEREWKQFPEKKALMERKAAALKQAMEVEERQHEKRVSRGNRPSWPKGRRRSCRKRAATLEERPARARRGRRRSSTSIDALFALPGGGGVSQLQVESKKNALLAAENAFASRRSKLGELNFAPKPRVFAGQVRSWRPAARSSTSCGCNTNRRRARSPTPRTSCGCNCRRRAWSPSRGPRIRFENIDKDNFLLILAPVSGVITDVTSTQPGDKIQANTPLGGIAPKNCEPVLKIEIAEHDRAFLREGLPVKLKFNAFPYQRYGLIDGTLNSFRPRPSHRRQTKQPVYEGRVTLDQDYYLVADNEVSAALRHDGDGRNRRARAAADRSGARSVPADGRLNHCKVRRTERLKAGYT